MDKPINVCVLVGSLRKASFNRMLANVLISLAPSSLKLDMVKIGQLPFYNEDLETAAPPARWTALRQRVKAADAVLFVTPEYNRSVRRSQERAGCRLQAIWQQHLGPQARSDCQQLARARSGASAPITISGSRSCF
jgi:NADPH-dependent FMN reductase